MIEISEMHKKFILLGLNCYLIGIGLVMVFYGFYQHESSLEEMLDATDKQEAIEDSGVINMVVGCLDAAVGVFGVVVAVLKKRQLLIVYTGIVGVFCLGNLTMMIVYGVQGSSTITSLKNDYRKSVESRYGRNYDKASRDFTRVIDDYQDDMACCGFSGSPDSGENVFEKTYWFEEINANRTTEKITLPDSCCQDASAECRSATDIKAAREKKLVNKFDCVERLVSSTVFTIVLTIICYFFNFAAQASAAAFCGLAIYTGQTGE